MTDGRTDGQTTVISRTIRLQKSNNSTALIFKMTDDIYKKYKLHFCKTLLHLTLDYLSNRTHFVQIHSKILVYREGQFWD